MRIHDETVEAVRQHARIEDQFSDGQLKKAGREFLARCPWHDDHRPSLTVSPRTNRAFCFVCARGTDAIGWIQETRGLTFADAVIELAGRYNIAVKAADEADHEKLQEESREKARLFGEAESRQAKLVANLANSPGQQYLAGRGLTDETVAEWGLGWSGSRVTFPLWDQMGRVVGHTGRVIDDSKPKYRNSRNSLIYQKAAMIYGLHKARDEIVRSGRVVVTEGQFDVIRCWQAGLRNLVAVSGSSLTESMISLLVRTTRAKGITLAFDSDTGGLKAADRALRELRPLALRGELDLRILMLPAGKDPADLAEQMAELLEEAVHWVNFWVERETAGFDPMEPSTIQLAENGIRRILKELPKGALREYVQGYSKDLLNSVPSVAPAVIQTQKQLDACAWAERRALRLYLLNPDSRPALSSVQYKDPINRNAQQLLQAIEDFTGGNVDSVRPTFARALKQAPVAMQDRLFPLVSPIPEVRQVVEANPVGELEAALSVLGECAPGDQG